MGQAEVWGIMLNVFVAAINQFFIYRHTPEVVGAAAFANQMQRALFVSHIPLLFFTKIYTELCPLVLRTFPVILELRFKSYVTDREMPSS